MTDFAIGLVVGLMFGIIFTSGTMLLVVDYASKRKQK